MFHSVDGLSWFVFDAAHIIATKIAKKHYEGFDRGDSLGFLGNTILMKLELWELVIVFNNNFYSATNLSAKCGR